MPTAIPSDLRLGQTTPREAVEVFQRRGELLPSFRWQDVFQDEHARGVAVAGVARMDILSLFQATLDQAIQEGRGDQWFRQQLRGQLVAKGWWGDIEITDPATGETRMTRFDDRRLNLILETNARMTHAAARWQRMWRQKDRRPWVLYETMHDERVSAQHALYDLVCRRIDDAWWDTHYPPCRYRCRCKAFSLSEQELQRRRDAGQKIRMDAPPEPVVQYINPVTGEVINTPIGVHPNFAYNPGKVGMRDKGLVDAIDTKRRTIDPDAAKVVVDDIIDAKPGLAPQLQPVTPPPTARVPDVALPAPAQVPGVVPPRAPLTREEFEQAMTDSGLAPSGVTVQELYEMTGGRMHPQELVRAVTGKGHLPAKIGGQDPSWLVVTKARGGAGVTVHGQGVPMPGGGRASLLTQTFDAEQRTARIDLLELPEGQQGAGVVKRLMPRLVDEYQRMGMQRIELTANLDVGGYAWARYGFELAPQGLFAYPKGADALSVLENAQLGTQAAQELADFMAEFDAMQSDMRWVHELINVQTPELDAVLAASPEFAGVADVTLMKALLLGSSWDALLRFDDPVAMARLRQYLYGKS